MLSTVYHIDATGGIIGGAGQSRAGKTPQPMDHRYIDEQQVAERYVNHALGGAERAAFEAHLVDCQECADRLLLAEMFHTRNGAIQAARAASFQLPPREIIDVQPRDAARFQHGWRSVATFLALAALVATVLCAIAAYWLSGR